MRSRLMTDGVPASQISDDIARREMAFSALHGFLMTTKDEANTTVRDARLYSRPPGVVVLLPLQPILLS